jgi:hypothetical protein
MGTAAHNKRGRAKDNLLRVASKHLRQIYPKKEDDADIFAEIWASQNREITRECKILLGKP